MVDFDVLLRVYHALRCFARNLRYLIQTNRELGFEDARDVQYHVKQSSRLAYVI